MLTKRLVNSGLFLYEGNFYDYQSQSVWTAGF